MLEPCSFSVRGAIGKPIVKTILLLFSISISHHHGRDGGTFSGIVLFRLSAAAVLKLHLSNNRRRKSVAVCGTETIG